MRVHPFRPSIALPDHISELRTLIYEGRMCLTDEFNILSGAIYSSKELKALADKFSYEALGYHSLKKGPGTPERSPIAEYKDGVIEEIRQDPDLVIFEPAWRDLFQSFAFEMASCMGSAFEVRIKCLDYTKELFHTDSGFIIGIQPLSDHGHERLSTVCKGRDNRRIESKGELVISTPALKHTWPVSGMPRMGLAATQYARHLG